MPAYWYALVGAAVVGLSLYRLTVSPDVLRRILAANMLGSGIFLILIAIAYRGPDAPDPIPHALVLTGIVVSVSATGLALVLARRLRSGSDRADDV